jgi:hypothetical protein
MKKFLFFCFVVAIVFACSNTSAFAQRETATGVNVEKDIILLRRDLRGDKKQLIALNLPLTEVEATKFWPVYDQFVAELSKHNDEFYGLIKNYVENQKTLTDAQASDMIKKWAEIQIQVAQTRQKYIPLVEKVLPGRKAALFFQVERRLSTLMDLQVSSQLPLMAQ